MLTKCSLNLGHLSHVRELTHFKYRCQGTVISIEDLRKLQQEIKLQVSPLCNDSLKIILPVMVN